MLVPLELQSAVIFLGQQSAKGIAPVGTAFFTSVPVEGQAEHRQVYLVTASHCVWNKDKEEPYRGLSVRVNGPAGSGTIGIDLPDGDHDAWHFHPKDDPWVDVVVLEWPLPDEAFNLGYRWVPFSMYFDEAVLGDDPNQGVGVGDEVVGIGLFSIHAGTERNEPLVRTGNLAMVPREPVQTNKVFGPMELYLTELRSIGGMSGSPVFVRHRAHIGEPSAMSLLGVLLGHYPAQGQDIRSEPLNMGIGMVAPAKRLGEILNQEAFVTRRKKAMEEQQERDGTSATMDRDLPHTEAVSREQFLHDLRKVTGKEEQQNRET